MPVEYLTPHPKDFEILAKITGRAIERLATDS